MDADVGLASTARRDEFDLPNDFSVDVLMRFRAIVADIAESEMTVVVEAALQDVSERIEAEIKRLGKMRSHNDKIRRGSDDIAGEIRKGESKLDVLLRKSVEVLKALNVEVADEQAERESPIKLPKGSIERASSAGVTP